ncbi:SpoIIE family protein phosphatase [Streptomyces sp. PA03-1a]|nr:SpoIIE family protein phosphatase [Streptomyces sp. PA03-1a]
MDMKDANNAYSASTPRATTSGCDPGYGGTPYAFDGLAAVVLDDRGTVVQWTGTARDLTGFTAEEVCGRPVHELVADLRRPLHKPQSGQVRLRHRCGNTIDVTFRATKVDGSQDVLVLAVPAHHVANHEQGAALLRALTAQNRIMVALHDTELTLVRTNSTPGTVNGRRVCTGSRLGDMLCTKDAENLEDVLRRVLATGVPVVRRNQRVRWRHDPARQQVLSLSAFRLENAQGHPTGVAALYVDDSDQLRARRHLDLTREVAEHVGKSLNVVRTAQDLANVLVPAIGDLVSVDLAQAVFEGEEPPGGGGDLHLRNAAMAPAAALWPAGIKPGGLVPPLPDHPLWHSFRQGETLTLSLEDYAAAIGEPRLIEFLVPQGCDSVMVAPLHTRGLTLGDISVWRTGRSAPFTDDEADLLRQISSQGALAIDNARRYTREHRAAVALRQRLLPPATTDTAAAETAGIHLPAGGDPAIGGDWFDAIALPSLRVALVAGDVVGHGIPATATMGRLRTAIQTLADLELEADELLARMADLVQRLAAEAPPGDHDIVGGTCLYALYDPISRSCTIASAGHPPPIVVRPDGTTEVVRICPGPPLAVGGVPYESTTINLDPGSVLALYTNGLIERDGSDIDQGLQRLTDALATACRPDRPLADTGRSLLTELAYQPPRDDAALLLARTRAIPPGHTADWEFPAAPSAVSRARETTARQLHTWGLDDLLLSTELIVSELLTNAIRYAHPPVHLRLIVHDDVLVCEVTDSSSTQPRLRHARTTDEGGRGLFLIAQLTARWGCRCNDNGKTIWAEQPIPTAPDDEPASS